MPASSVNFKQIQQIVGAMADDDESDEQATIESKDVINQQILNYTDESKEKGKDLMMAVTSN